VEITIIGFGPDEKLRPFMPGILLTDPPCLYNASGSSPLIPASELEKLIVFHKITRCEPFKLSIGNWLVIKDDEITFFPLGKEAEYRTSLAHALLEKAKGLQGDPLKAVSMMAASAALVGIDLDSLKSDIENSIRPGETFSDAYDRIKKR
jgi:hypothetical protein